MSYLVLARKWRPQGFDDLIGQEPISRILKNALANSRIAHAYLFSGPRGVGKTSAARILARALNCEQGPTQTPCGACTSCLGIADGSSVDVMEIDGASNNSVNDIRDLRERVRYAPAGGRYKVYIIDEAHMLSDSAFNALLKTLEEPPPHVVFVLATTAPRKIPATVLSRCQHLPFRRVPLPKITARLRRIADAEGIRISDGAIELVGRAAEGSMRDSLTILDQVSAFASDIEEAEIKDLLGVADFGALAGLITSVIQGERKEIVQGIAGLADTGTDFRVFTKDLLQFCRDLLVAKVAGGAVGILDLSESEWHAMEEIIGLVAEEHLTLLLGEMIRAEQEVRLAYSPRIALEMALIRASFLGTLRPVKEAIERIGSMAGTGPEPEAARTVRARQPSPSTQKTEEPPPPKEKTPLAIENVSDDKDLQDNKGGTGTFPAPGEELRQAAGGEGDFWQQFVKAVEDVNHPLASKLSAGRPRLEGGVLTVVFNGGAEILADSIRKNRKTLEGVAASIAGRPLQIKVEAVDQKTPTRKEMKEKVVSHPLVQGAIELFDGRIVDVRPKEQIENGG